MNEIPVGYVRVHKESSPEGYDYFTFTRWDGERWQECWPENANELVSSHTNSRGGIYNRY